MEVQIPISWKEKLQLGKGLCPPEEAPGLEPAQVSRLLVWRSSSWAWALASCFRLGARTASTA